MPPRAEPCPVETAVRAEKTAATSLPAEILRAAPVPGYGSSSKDELNTDYVRPPMPERATKKFDDSTSDRLEKSGNYEVRISKASSANQASGEALYRGQQQVDAAAIFQSIEAFVWDHDSDLNFYWTLDDLCVNGEDDSKSYIK